MICILVFVFGLRGLLRGMIRQLAALFGLLAGLWAAGWVSYALGIHWREVVPIAGFWFLRWVVVALAALAVAALIGWLGDALSGLVHSTPFAWIDRPLGFVVGSTLGVALATFVTLWALLTPWPTQVRDAASRSALAPPLMAASAWVCSLGNGWIPGSAWLERRFLAALRHTDTAGRII